MINSVYMALTAFFFVLGFIALCDSGEAIFLCYMIPAVVVVSKYFCVYGALFNAQKHKLCGLVGVSSPCPDKYSF